MADSPIMETSSYYDRKEELSFFIQISDNPQSLFAPLVRYHYQDRQGNYWLASARGIKKMSSIHKFII